MNPATPEMHSTVTFATNDIAANIISDGQQLQPRAVTDLISIDAIILLGLVQCKGTTREKAEVFARIVAPEMQPSILVNDEDIRTALYFMISIATIFEEMTRDMIEAPTLSVDWQVYWDKVIKYAPTYEGMIEDF